jgi:hypothetical protein
MQGISEDKMNELAIASKNKKIGDEMNLRGATKLGIT